MTDHSKLNAYIAEIEAAAEQRGAERERARLQPLLDQLMEIVGQIVSPADRNRIAHEGGDVAHRDIKPTNILGHSLPRESSDQYLVLMDINAFPGSRGVQIVNRLPSIEERTIRTALFRLKNKGLIYQSEGNWYPSPKLKDHENEEGQLSLNS